MRKHARDKDARFFIVLESGIQLDNCIWADDVTGEYCTLFIEGVEVKERVQFGCIRLVDTREDQ